MQVPTVSRSALVPLRGCHCAPTTYLPIWENEWKWVDVRERKKNEERERENVVDKISLLLSSVETDRPTDRRRTKKFSSAFRVAKVGSSVRPSSRCLINFFFKWAPASFLFIFVLFKHNFTDKTVGFSGIRTRIDGVEGEHTDHLTTTTAQFD